MRQTAPVRPISRSPSLPDRWEPAGIAPPPSGMAYRPRLRSRCPARGDRPGADGGGLRAVLALTWEGWTWRQRSPRSTAGWLNQPRRRGCRGRCASWPGHAAVPRSSMVSVRVRRVAVAVGRQLRTAGCPFPPHLERPGRVVDEQLTAEVGLRHEVADEPQPGTGHPVAVGLDPLREPGVAVLGSSGRAPFPGQPALKTDRHRPPDSLSSPSAWSLTCTSMGSPSPVARALWLVTVAGHGIKMPLQRSPGWWPQPPGTARTPLVEGPQRLGTQPVQAPLGVRAGGHQWRRAAPAGASTPPTGSGRARRRLPRCARSHAAGRDGAPGCTAAARQTVQRS